MALRQAAGTRDPALIFDPELDLAVASMLSAEGVEPGTAEWLAAAWFYWSRFAAVRAGPTAYDDLKAATALFASLYGIAPDAVPDGLAERFGSSAPAGAAWQAHDAAIGLLAVARRTRSVQLVERCVAVLDNALTQVAGNVTDYRVMLCNLGMALRDRYDLTGNVADQEASIAAVRESVRLTPPDSPHLAARWTNLALALRGRFDRTGDEANLDEAITWGLRALEASPAGTAARAGVITNVAPLFMFRFESTGREADLRAAVTLLQEAISGDRDDPGLGGQLTNAALGLRLLFERTSRLADIDTAAALAERAVELTGGSALTLTNLSVVLRTRYQRTAEPGDLEKALAAARAALAATQPGSQERSLGLSTLSLVLATQATAAGTAPDRCLDLLDEAVRAGHAAVDQLPTSHPSRARRQVNLGAVLQSRYDRTGDCADLDAVIRILHQCLESLPDEHVDRAVTLTNLGIALKSRFEQSGDRADLDAGIERTRLALAGTPAEHLDRPGRLSNLGVALTERYALSGARRDLDEAIATIRDAVRAVASSHPFAAAVLSNLSGSLQELGRRTLAPGLVDEAVETAERALAAAPAGHPDRAAALTNLAGALLTRHVHPDPETGEDSPRADLDAAVTASEHALAAAGPAGPEIPSYSANLASLLVRRYDLCGDTEDLQTARALAEQSVAMLDDTAPDRARCLLELGTILRRSHGISGDRSALAEAITHFRAAHEQSSAPTRLRIRAASNWGECAASTADWSGADTAFSAAVGLLARLTGHELDRGDREYELAAISGLACDAAAAALQAGDPERALGLLELGRGVLLGQALDARTDLTELAAQEPELAERFTWLRRRLGQAGSVATATLPVVEVPARLHEHGSDRHRLAAELDELIARIRTIPRFERFLLPPTVVELSAAAAGGPVVTVNVSRYRVDALVLTRDGLTTVPFPELGLAEIRHQARNWVSVVTEETDQPAAERTMHDVLAWLWTRIAEPVLRHLSACGYDSDPPFRMWWCATGLLSYLPLHAAGLQSSPDSVLDRAVSSATPTIRALLHSRNSAPPVPRSAAAALVVALSQTPDAPGLPGATAEAAAIRHTLPCPVAELAGGEATREQLLAALLHHPLVHFACHAQIDPADPSTGRLLIHDHRDSPLTVADISALQLPDARLAVLSACSTAAPSAALVDEGIQLVSSFQLAGYRQVIGTLWPVCDRVAVRFTRRFYAALTRSGAVDVENAAAAFRSAVLDLRSRWPGRPAAWAAFVHSGS